MSAAAVAQRHQVSSSPSSVNANRKSKGLSLSPLSFITHSGSSSHMSQQSSSAHVTFPLASPTSYSHLPSQLPPPSPLKSLSPHQQQPNYSHPHHQQIRQSSHLVSSPSSPRSSAPASPLLLSPSNTNHSTRVPLSPRARQPVDPSSVCCPPYLFELAQADRRGRSGFISREPSLPSIMSMPPTRPASPNQARSRKTSFANRRNHYPSDTSPSLSGFSSPQVSRQFFSPPSARGLSNLCMFENGLQHYERVRSPSLRGHSRRGSLIHTISEGPKDPLADRIFELDLGDDNEDETFRQPRWSDEEDDPDSDGDQETKEGRSLFQVGDRLGVGTLHQGYRVRDLFEPGSANPTKLTQAECDNHANLGILEIVRQIGVGSYAVVYLVREVLFDPDLESDSASLDGSMSQTPKASNGFGSLSVFDNIASTRKRSSSQVVYGREFALKCLSKRNLSDELLVLQRGEAELHRSLPLHDNIVALHRALETPNWLFLVIEYCPGQDLFYWLEQARDSQDLESLSSRTNSCAPNFPSPVPAAWLDSEERPNEHFSSEATTAPLNNTPPSPSLLASTADDEMLSRRRLRLISKMFVQMCDAVEACHQAGVCHRDIKPENFIVVDDRKGRSGDNWKTKPTDQKIGPRSSVIVKITDWGLGTNAKACEDFDCGSKPYMAYECRNNLHPTYDPIQADVWSLGIVLLNLLYHRCPWADPSASDPDFCEFRRAPVGFLRDRFEGMTASVATFLAERVFSVVDGQREGRISAGQFGEWAKNLLEHMGGGQSHASVSDATIALSPSSARGLLDQRHSLRGSSLRGSSKRSSQLFQSISLPDSVAEDLTPIELPPLAIEKEVCEVDEKDSVILLSEKSNDFHDILEEPAEILADEALSLQRGAPEEAINEDAESCTSGNKSGPDKPKRRKRGARKGRKPDGRRSVPDGSEPLSSTQESAEDDVLDGLAEASQSLAREISQATKIMKPSDGTTTTTTTTAKRKLNIAERMMEKFRDGSNPDLQAFIARARAREAAYMGKVNSNVASAPAQLQDIHRPGQKNVSHQRATMSTTYSAGVSMTMSSSSTTSWGGGSSDCSSFSKPQTHWSSASNRRERILKTNPTSLGGSTTATPPVPSLPPSRKEAAATTSTTAMPNKKEESKNKLAQLLTSFKRFNSTVGNHHSGSTSANTTAATTTHTDNP